VSRFVLDMNVLANKEFSLLFFAVSTRSQREQDCSASNDRDSCWPLMTIEVGRARWQQRSALNLAVEIESNTSSPFLATMSRHPTEEPQEWDRVASKC